jgi:hypothetical protein
MRFSLERLCAHYEEIRVGVPPPRTGGFGLTLRAADGRIVVRQKRKLGVFAVSSRVQPGDILLAVNGIQAHTLDELNVLLKSGETDVDSAGNGPSHGFTFVFCRARPAFKMRLPASIVAEDAPSRSIGVLNPCHCTLSAATSDFGLPFCTLPPQLRAPPPAVPVQLQEPSWGSQTRSGTQGDAIAGAYPSQKTGFAEQPQSSQPVSGSTLHVVESPVEVLEHIEVFLSCFLCSPCLI